MAEEVEVRLVKGEYLPCKRCRWFRDCVVPRHKHLPKLGQPVIKRIWTRCQDFEAI